MTFEIPDQLVDRSAGFPFGVRDIPEMGDGRVHAA